MTFAPALPSPREEALALVGRLREALSRQSVVLPSLAVDLPSFADARGRPLIDLGRCNLETARALLAALGVEAE